MAMKSLNEKWFNIVQSTGEKGENEVGGFSTVTLALGIGGEHGRWIGTGNITPQ